MTAPQYGHRSYYAPPEGIAVTAKYNTAFGTFFDFFKPQIYVDGIEAPIMGWGRTTVPAAAGRHEVHVHTKYLFPPRPARRTARSRCRRGSTSNSNTGRRYSLSAVVHSARCRSATTESGPSLRFWAVLCC